MSEDALKAFSEPVVLRLLGWEHSSLATGAVGALFRGLDERL